MGKYKIEVLKSRPWAGQKNTHAQKPAHCPSNRFAGCFQVHCPWSHQICPISSVIYLFKQLICECLSEMPCLRECQRHVELPLVVDGHFQRSLDIRFTLLKSNDNEMKRAETNDVQTNLFWKYNCSAIVFITSAYIDRSS